MAKKKIENWEIDSAVDTLIRANEILNDGRLLPRVKHRFVEKQRALRETALELKITQKQIAVRNKRD